MKLGKVLISASILLVLFCCVACKKEKTLHLYTWADYIKPELVTEFEKQNNCKVVIDTFDSNESMYAKLNAGATGYDVVVPTTYMVQLMHQQGMIADFDKTRLPNLSNVDPEYLAKAPDAGMQYSAPYACGYAGIAYDSKVVSEAPKSWSAFSNPEYKGRMTMLNDMRETIGAALKYLGFSLNTTNEAELAQAKNVLVEWKKNLAKFENEQYKTGVASGEFVMVHGYAGDVLQIQEQNPDVQFVIPEEGTSITCDEMVIPKSAAEVELAHAFINYIHNPSVAAQNSEFTKFLNPNRPSYEMLSEELKNDPAVFLKPEVKAKSEVMKDLGEDNAKYVKVWDELKAAE